MILVLCLDESLLSFLTSNSPISSIESTNSVKQRNYIPIQSYANLLLDDNDLPNSLNEPRPSILLIDNCDLHS
jgi:hypothetical protein